MEGQSNTAPAGMNFTRVEGEVTPPLAGGGPGMPPPGDAGPAAAAAPGPDGQPAVSPGTKAALDVSKQGKLPLHPAVVRLPVSIMGRIGTELTGYPGFTFTEQELNDMADLWMQTGVQMTPMMQAAIGTTSMIGGKFVGYVAWRKMGSPQVKGADSIGKEKGPEEKTDATGQ